jgi:hypothetical protein
MRTSIAHTPDSYLFLSLLCVRVLEKREPEIYAGISFWLCYDRFKRIINMQHQYTCGLLMSLNTYIDCTITVLSVQRITMHLKNRTQTVELSTGTIIQSRTWKHYDMSNLVDLHIYIVQKENLNEQHAFHLRRN